MKIFFNPVNVKNFHTNNYLKQKDNNFLAQNNVSLSSLTCLANYNLPFCSKNIYVIDYDGTYEKYESRKEILNRYGSSVYQALRKGDTAIGSKVFVYEDSLDTSDKTPDKKVIANAIEVFRNSSSQPVYAIEFNGEVVRYPNIKEAAIHCFTTRSSISNVLNENAIICGAYTFVKAIEVEARDEEGKLLRDEQGKPLLDVEKINDLRERFLYADGKVPLLEISKDGSLRVFQTAIHAAKELGCDRNNIYQAISRCGLCHERAYVRLIEMVAADGRGRILFNDDGTYMFDMKKIEEYKKEAYTNRRKLPRKRLKENKNKINR